MHTGAGDGQAGTLAPSSAAPDQPDKAALYRKFPMPRSSPATRPVFGAASLGGRVVAMAAAALLAFAGTTGAAVAQGDEFPGPDSPECSWAGERILSLMWRDDIRTASDFLDLYDRFDCPSEHVPIAFRCLVKVGVSPEQGDPGLPARVHACWVDPALDPASLQPAAAAAPQAEGGAPPAEAPAPDGEQPPVAQQPAAQ